MSLFGKLLPIIAGLGITAATGGLGAPLGAAVAGGGAAAGAGAAGLGAAGLGAAAAPALAETAATTGLATGAATAAESGLAAGAASAAPAIAAPLAPLATPGATAPLAMPAAPFGHSIVGNAMSTPVGPVSGAMPSLPETQGFLGKTADYLGNHPMVPLLAAGALMKPEPKGVPQQSLNAAPVYSAPQSQPMKPGGIPDRQFQTALISNLRR